MIRLLGLLGTAASLAIAGVALLGSGGSGGMPRHIGLGFIALLLCLLHLTALLVFGVGMIRRAREAVGEKKAMRGLLRDLPSPLELGLPPSAAIVLVSAAVILGGGAHTGAVPGWLHGGLGGAAVAAQVGVTWWQGRTLRRIQAVVARLGAAGGVRG